VTFLGEKVFCSERLGVSSKRSRLLFDVRVKDAFEIATDFSDPFSDRDRGEVFLEPLSPEESTESMIYQK